MKIIALYLISFMALSLFAKSSVELTPQVELAGLRSKGSTERDRYSKLGLFTRYARPVSALGGFSLQGFLGISKIFKDKDDSKSSAQFFGVGFLKHVSRIRTDFTLNATRLRDRISQSNTTDRRLVLNRLEFGVDATIATIKSDSIVVSPVFGLNSEGNNNFLSGERGTSTGFGITWIKPDPEFEPEFYLLKLEWKRDSFKKDQIKYFRNAVTLSAGKIF
jgi:hypothetical protein